MENVTSFVPQEFFAAQTSPLGGCSDCVGSWPTRGGVCSGWYFRVAFPVGEMHTRLDSLGQIRLTTSGFPLPQVCVF